MRETLEKLLSEQFPGVQFDYSEFRGELTVSFPKEIVIELCDYLKNEPLLDFIQLEDVTAIDWAKRSNRFQVVYQMFSIKNKFRLRLVTSVDESECEIDSVYSVWKSADWAERETYDMYGIHFRNHPDLRRMYMPEEFEYHPLRKDFPLMGIPGSLPLPKK
ncbi:MAG: NADH-quinone oxidoreductase subunit C [Ignavibacteriaceae bacterium]|nr:NADH-quinone oxidoreductase subunit C [Ignavibacteriaceae bacterium]